MLFEGGAGETIRRRRLFVAFYLWQPLSLGNVFGEAMRMTNIRMVFRSKLMVLGVACEFLALIAAAGNWFAGSWSVWQLLPNVALTLATLGAVLVAGRVAWDYHGRGLNERQKE